jgi:hypothetical protein
MMIGVVEGIGNGYDKPGSAKVNVTDEWEIELVVEGREDGPTARILLSFDPGPNSATALARLLLEAEKEVVDRNIEAVGERNSRKSSSE